MDGNVVTGAKADEILTEARARFKLAVDAEADNRELALDDLKFLNGEQWDEQALKFRKGRPCLTINRLPQYVRQVVNEQRKTRPAIEVIPGDSKASKPTAEVIQGLVRHIERSSRARIAYDTAFEYAVSCGVGHFRVTTRYVDDESFDQEIVIETIDNPFLVYRDPAAKELDHSDDRFTFVSEFVEVEEFEEKYGFNPTSFEDAGKGDEIAPWYDGDTVRVAEYWRVECEDSELHSLSDGNTITGAISKAMKDELAVLGVTVKSTRKVEKRTVEQYLITHDKVLKKSEWKGRYIPILTSLGGVLNIEGERKITSLIRYAKDPARMYNYWASSETEMVALQPKVPYIGAEGSFDGHETQWSRANQDNVAYLEYVPIDGQPPPQRNQLAGLPAGVREGRMAAAEDIKAVLGMYDASLGAKSNETSGVAIKARQQEGDTGTFHFIDNHARSIEQCGRIIIDLLPKVYDTARVVRIIGDDDEESTTTINQVFVDPNTQREMLHDLNVGKYEVAVRVGPSFESKRQEMVQAMVELSAANPQILQVAGDLILKNMDFPQAEQIAERLYMTLPPAMRGEQPQPSPEDKLIEAQVKVETIKGQAALAKSQGDLQGKGAELQVKQLELQVAQQELALKQQELRLREQEMTNKHSLEMAKLQVEREKIAAESASAIQAAMQPVSSAFTQ